LLELVVQSHGSLAGSLAVELCGEGDLEENVLHNIAAVGALELEFTALVQHIVETPHLGAKNGGNTLFTLLDEEGKVNGAGAGITGGPRLAGHGVGSMA